jgi:hypothetical protein
VGTDMKPHPNIIRQKMIKYPNFYLWDKSIWSKEDLVKFKKLNIPTNRFKTQVLRLCDDFIYESIKKCILTEKLCKKTMYKKLKEEIEFKRL